MEPRLLPTHTLASISCLLEVKVAEVKYHSIGSPILSALTFDTLSGCAVARPGKPHRDRQLDVFRFYIASSRFVLHQIWAQLRVVVHHMSGLNLHFEFRRYSIDSGSDRPQPIHQPDLGDLCRTCYLEIVTNQVRTHALRPAPRSPSPHCVQPLR
jgi:hypothetical protein